MRFFSRSQCVDTQKKLIPEVEVASRKIFILDRSSKIRALIFYPAFSCVTAPRIVSSEKSTVIKIVSGCSHTRAIAV